MSAVLTRERLYKEFRHNGLEPDKDNFKAAKMHLLKMIVKKKKCYLEGKLAKNSNKPKGLWKALKSFRQSKKIKNFC